MFSIETKEDVQILKELTNSSNEEKIKELENEIKQLTEQNKELFKATQEQNKLLKSLITKEECKDIVFNLLNSSSKIENIKRRTQPTTQNTENEEFTFTNAMQKKYNKIIVNGNKLIHLTKRNQKMDFPITTLELLALIEVYNKRKRTLLNKDSKNICKIYEINKVQFGKLYYNIKEGVFFKALDEVDNQIRKTNFKYKNGTIHIVEGTNSIDTKIDSKTFNQLLNIYINSNQPYSTIYKLSRERKDINPIHLLAVLRKNPAVSQAIING